METKWIWIDHEPATEQKKVLFTRKFTVDGGVSTCPIEICADSRYLLFVNGQRMLTGPCRSPRDVWYVDQVDIGPALIQGENEILVEVLQFWTHPEYDVEFRTGPTSITTQGSGGLWVRELETVLGISTSSAWLCRVDEGYIFKRDMVVGYTGAMEYIDARLSGDNASWQPAVELSLCSQTMWPNWNTKPRTIPYPYERDDVFRRTVRSSGFEGSFEDRWVVPAGGTAVLELDAGRLVNAYPRIRIQCGQGSTMRITYAEGYGVQNEDGTVSRGVRDNPEGQGVYGFADFYIAKEGEQSYIPFLFRCFRVVKFEITASKDASFVLYQPDYIKTGYPLEITGSFTCSEPVYEDIWQISSRTLRRCMYETYMDCPYYEHMQYLMDTFLEIRYTLSVSSDVRLAEKAILDFADSQFNGGLMPCNAPAKFRQIIPGFPFYWPLMLETYMLYAGKKDFLRKQLGTLDRLLNFYQHHLTPDGLLGDMGYWQFFDWVQEWNRGCPVEAGEIHILYNMLYVYALRAGAKVSRFCERQDAAAEYEARADVVAAAVRKCAYDEELGLFSDSPGRQPSSQHAQIFAVLSGVMPEEGQRSLMERMIANRAHLSVPSYCFSYFLCRALEQTGLYKEIHDTFHLWDVFIGLTDLRLTTWPEDFVTMRSDCHGWSALALYEFATCYLGVRPLAPGYNKVEIRPLPCHLERYSGTVPVGEYGVVSVSVWKDEAGERHVQIQIPEGLSVQTDFSALGVSAENVKILN